MIRKAIIPAVSWDTQLLPVIKSIPKEMFPIIDKPCIHYVIEEAIQSGIEEIVIVIGDNCRVIEDYFKRSLELEFSIVELGDLEKLEQVQSINLYSKKIQFVRQHEPLGIAHAISLARVFIGNEPFALLMGDELIQSEIPAIRQLIDVYEKHQFPVIAVQVEQKAGQIQPDIYFNESYTESFIGRYVLDSSIFDTFAALHKKIESKTQFNDALRLMSGSMQLMSCMLNGQCYDISTRSGYFRAIVELFVSSSTPAKVQKPADLGMFFEPLDQPFLI